MSYVAYNLSLVYAVVFLSAMAMSARSRAQNNGLFYMFLLGATVIFASFAAPFEMHAFDPLYGTLSTAELVVILALGTLGGGSMMALAVICHRKFKRLGYNNFNATKRRI